MRCAYKLRAYPTRPQGGRSVRLLADHCDLYNAALAERREAWRMRSISVRYGDQSAQLKEIRAAGPDGRGRHSCTAQQQTLRRLNVAFAAYFRRVRAAGKERRVGYPRFKPYQRWAYASFQAVGRVKASQHRPVVGRVKSLQLKREGRRWYVVVVTGTETVPLPTTGRHKTARGLVDSCDTIALEDLRVAAMTASAAGTVGTPGRNVAQKAGLNRSILDAGWGQFTSILAAKAESAGRRVVLVHPGRTSMDCHSCGTGCIRPRQDTVVCPVHGELDADLNGARNIATRAGLGSGQASAA